MAWFGGYKLVDFKNVNLIPNNATYIKNIHKRAQSLFVKRFVAYNLVIDGDQFGETDMAIRKAEDNKLICEVGAFELTIDPSDYVFTAVNIGIQTINGKSGQDVILNATDIKLTSNQQSIQQNFIRVDENADQMSGNITNIGRQLGMHASLIEAHAELILEHSEAISNINANLTNQGIDIAKLKPFYVRVSISGTSGTFVNYTYDSLCAAIASGQNIILYDGASEINKGNLYHISYNVNNEVFQFNSVFYDVALKNRILQINSGGIEVVTRNFAN